MAYINGKEILFSPTISVDNGSLIKVIDGSVVDLEIPHGTTTIKPYTFTGCIYLKSITIPNTVTSIGSTAFSYCGALESIKIPKSVGYIDSYAFNNCTKCLIYDFSEHTSVPVLPNDTVFYAINTNAKIIVPEDLFLTWYSATNWVTYRSYITTPNNGFYFNGCIAIDGMTWGEWVASEYNTAGYYIDSSGYVWISYGQLCDTTTGDYIGVKSIDTIDKNKSYTVS